MSPREISDLHDKLIAAECHCDVWKTRSDKATQAHALARESLSELIERILAKLPKAPAAATDEAADVEHAPEEKGASTPMRKKSLCVCS